MQPIKIIVCGDFRAAHPEKISFSNELTDLFANSDLRICNFEAPIHVEGAKRLKKSGPSLDQSANSPAILVEKGFNAILLANNHIMDFGEEGMWATKDKFRDVVVAGAGTAKEAFAVQFIETKCCRIGILSLVHHEYGVVDYMDDKACGAAWMGSPDIPGIIVDAKKKCDYLLVFPHAGIEHTAAPLPELRKLYKRFIEWGADAVVASHPHCPQGFETHQGKPIYYSLGDFYFDELTCDDLWYKSIVVELNLGDTISAKEHYYCFDDKTGIIFSDTSNRISSYMNYANELLRDEKQYMNYIDTLCDTLWNEYKYALLRGLGGISFKLHIKLFARLLGCMVLGDSDMKSLLNAIQCESGRWVAERYLKKTINNS